MSAPPALIASTTALASIATWSLSILFLVPLLARRIAPQAFPRSNRHRFIASDSSLRYVRIRARLLFALSVATLVDGLNNGVHFAIAWRYGRYYTLAHRLVLPVSFSALPPLAVLSLCYRCAVIIVSDQAQRMRFVKYSQVACVGAWALHATGVLVLTYWMVADGVPESVQLVDRWVPVWGTIGSAGLPVVAVGGSVWSLRLAYDGRRQRRDLGGPVDEDQGGRESNIKPEHSAGARREGSLLATVREYGGSTGSHLPTSTSATAVPLSLTAAVASPSTLTPSRSQAQINYPLTKTFRILTYGTFLTWVLATTLLLFPMVGPIRNNAIFNMIFTLTIALESSFEKLLKRHNRRQSLHRRVGGDAGHPAGMMSTRGGNGNGEMVGESMLEVAGGIVNTGIQ